MDIEEFLGLLWGKMLVLRLFWGFVVDKVCWWFWFDVYLNLVICCEVMYWLLFNNLIFLLNILFLFLSLDGENLNFGLYDVVIFFGFENKGILGLLGLGVLE